MFSDQLSPTNVFMRAHIIGKSLQMLALKMNLKLAYVKAKNSTSRLHLVTIRSDGLTMATGSYATVTEQTANLLGIGSLKRKEF